MVKGLGLCMLREHISSSQCGTMRHAVLLQQVWCPELPQPDPYTCEVPNHYTGTISAQPHLVSS
jgi:hypothetical protein